MKKALVAIAIAFIVVGAAAAQPFGQWNQPRGTVPGRGQVQAAPYGRMGTLPAADLSVEEISLEGTLELVDARVAIKKDDKTYFVMIPSRFFGFVEGLKEGASVKIEGYTRALPNVENSFVVHVNTLDVGGKTIDLGLDEKAVGFRSGMMGQRDFRGSMGGRSGKWGR
ncbi:MAG: hypothetical protein RBT72_00970 [Spirochaetia bacterium]|jgi:hypothetical protein|nr:hypothetical protein [Spirochaetales bacterium]MDX9783312.1 hypothetical protein [Spirochaetia bacterium]